MIKASDYCFSVFDGTHDTPKPVEEGYKLLTSKNILNGRLDTDDAYYISEKDYEEINRRSKVHKWDILFSMIGTVGNVCIVTSKEIDFAIKNMGVFSCRDECKAKWLYYYLQSPHVKKQIDFFLNGAVQKFLPLNWLRNFEIPELNEDRNRIAELLWYLDTKIKENLDICSELESMAKTLYDYWFTQFDFPDENGKPYRASGGEMEWNEQLKREIPKGWDVGNLYAIATPINGLACQKYRPAEGESSLPVVKITEMHEGITNNTESVSVNIPEKHKIYDGDILFSWSATLEVMYWYGGNAGLNQHIFKVVPKSGYSKEYVYHQFSSYVINFVKMAEARKTTMGHITTDHLEQSRIVLLPEPIVEAFTKTIAPIHEKIGQCQKENRELKKLRDWLLPMLMNGQATVE